MSISWFDPDGIPMDLDQIDWDYELDNFDSCRNLPRPTLEPWYLDQNYLDNLLKAFIWDLNDCPCLDCGSFCLQLCGKRAQRGCWVWVLPSILPPKLLRRNDSAKSRRQIDQRRKIIPDGPPVQKDIFWRIWSIPGICLESSLWVSRTGWCWK